MRIIDALVFVFALGLFIYISVHATPSLGPGKLTTASGEVSDFTMPLMREKIADKFTVDLTVHLPIIHPAGLHIIPDDKLERLWVNGKEVKISEPIEWESGGIVELNEYWTRGNNFLKLEMSDKGGKSALFIQYPANYRSILNILKIFIVVGLFSYGLVRFAD